MESVTTPSNGSHSSGNLARMAKQAWRGVPYLKKEIARSLSMRLQKPLVGPQIYYVIFSGRCNVSCTFCTIWKEVEPMLSGEVMLRIVREARELSGTGFNISLSGGEPLIYRPLYEVLESAHKLGVNFGFTTNGYLLTKDNVARALAADLFNINISLESVDPAVNERVRPRKNGTQQTLQGIDNIVAEKRRTGARVAIMVKTTIMDQNYKTLPDLLKFFSKYKEVQVSLQPYIGPPNDFWIKDVDEFERVVADLKALRHDGGGLMADPGTLDDFIHYFRNPPKNNIVNYLDLEGKRRGCDVGFRTMIIAPNGSVQFCDLLKNPDIGNVHQQSLKDIYYGEVARKQRNKIDFCSIDCQRTCQRAIPISSKVRAFLRMG